MVRMNVSLDDPLVEELRRTVPVRQRSRFISEAVREKLNRLKQERAVRTAAGIWSSEGRGCPEDEISSLRSKWSQRTDRLDEAHG